MFVAAKGFPDFFLLLHWLYDLCMKFPEVCGNSSSLWPVFFSPERLSVKWIRMRTSIIIEMTMECISLICVLSAMFLSFHTVSSFESANIVCALQPFTSGFDPRSNTMI